ncbi:MAG: SH3 domain-containing protein [Clostridia bacterium]|nr:SH3 domain-containing protein [Clostridia bacterium]
MKCNFCGNDLPSGADFCPECGMIISLDASADKKEEAADTQTVPEVPDFTPNVFKTMEFEEEAAAPAMELEADISVETAPVIEAIPEYSAEMPAAAAEPVEAAPETPAEPVEAAPEAPAEPIAEQQEVFAPPEYTSELAYLDDKEPEPTPAETPEAQAQALFGNEFSPVAETVPAATEDTIVMDLNNQQKPSEGTAPVEDNSLIEALFDPSAYGTGDEHIEDITQAHNEQIKKEKAKKQNSNKGYAMVFALVIVLVGIIFAAGYVMDNILPKIQDGTTTTDTSVNASVPITTLPTTTKPTTTLPTTVQPASSTTTTTTNPSSTSATSTTNPSSTTTTTTTRPSSTTTTTTTTTQSSQSVSEPSRYDMGYVAYFPKNGAVTMRTKASSSAATVATQPYGYPLYAMASENGYYYVESPYHDLEGWVLASSLEKYEEATTTTTRPSSTTTTTKPSDTTTTTEPTTSGSTTTETTTEYDDGYTEYATPYTATITDALNFRSGPGTDYSILRTVPYGYTVTVHGYSATNNGWVYVEVTDERYEQYGAIEGWVLSDYLS